MLSLFKNSKEREQGSFQGEEKLAHCLCSKTQEGEIGICDVRATPSWGRRVGLGFGVTQAVWQWSGSWPLGYRSLPCSYLACSSFCLKPWNLQCLGSLTRTHRAKQRARLRTLSHRMKMRRKMKKSEGMAGMAWAQEPLSWIWNVLSSW